MTEPAREPRPARPSGVVEVLLTVAGVLIAVWGSFVLAVWGALLTPLRIGGVPAPVSIVIAVLGNAAIIWFGYTVTRRMSLTLLPGAVWLVVAFAAAQRTTEGDLIFTGDNWVAIVYLVAGSITTAGLAYRLILRRQLAPWPDPPRPARTEHSRPQ